MGDELVHREVLSPNWNERADGAEHVVAKAGAEQCGEIGG